jgi:cell division protein ZapA (FtsZ GTPase activity inhibitor)
MEKRQLKIDLLGTSFVIQSGESPEHLARVSACLRDKVEEVKARYSFADPLRVALLAALNLADELIKEREGLPRDEPNVELESVARKLIETIDEELLDHTPYPRPEIPEE